MVFRPNILWIERISSTITILTWWLRPFVYSALFGFLMAILVTGLELLKNKLMIGLLSVIMFRYVSLQPSSTPPFNLILPLPPIQTAHLTTSVRYRSTHSP